MALNFRRRLFRTPNKTIQYILAFIALLAVLAIVACWAIISQNSHATHSGSSDSESDNSHTVTFTSEDKGNLLCVVADSRNARFYLIQSDPAQNSIYIMPISQNLLLDNNKTIVTIYQESGIIKATSSLAKALDLSLVHHLSITPTNATKWLTRARDGIPVEIKNGFTYIDDKNIKTTIPAGQLNATATQAAILLHHSDETGAATIASLLNRYITTDRYLMNDFSDLCNRVTQTDLRIDNFTSYRDAFSHLAKENAGSISTILTLPTTTDTNGATTIDHRALKRLPIYN